MTGMVGDYTQVGWTGEAGIYLRKDSRDLLIKPIVIKSSQMRIQMTPTQAQSR